MSTTEVAAVKPPAKEKKAPASKPKSSKNASHPPYFEMIKDALLALKEKGGSSPHAISKHIEEKQKAALPANFRKILGQQLKNYDAKGKLIKVRASYKLSESGKKAAKEKKAPKKKVEKVMKTVSVAAAAAAAAKKAESVQKTKKVATPVKKPAKAKAKQPKSIKSPVKKAKKVAA